MSNIISASEACNLSKNKTSVFVEKRLDEINKLIHEACEHGFFEIKVRSCSLESINRDIVDKLKRVGYKVTLLTGNPKNIIQHRNLVYWYILTTMLMTKYPCISAQHVVKNTLMLI